MFENDEELKALEIEAEKNREKKAYLGAFGGVLDQLQSVPSSHELLFGGKGAAPTASKVLGAAADSIQDPMERKKKAEEYLKQKRQAKMDNREIQNAELADKELAARKDAAGSRSIGARSAYAKHVGKENVADTDSEYDLEQRFGKIGDWAKMSAQEKAKAKAVLQAQKFERQMKERELDIELAKSGATQQFQRDQQGRQFAHDKVMQGDRLTAEQEKLRALAETNANSPKKQFERLPEDKQLTITELSKKNANKKAIKNQIDSVMAGWDALSDDQKVTTGRQLLKTLNSSEGADAIGAEESKRLGAKLEFAMGNFMNDNPTQFGRDLPGFKTQAENVSKSIGGAVDANQKMIDEAYGRVPAGPPKDPEAEEYAKQHGISYEQALRIKQQRTSNIGKR